MTLRAPGKAIVLPPDRPNAGLRVKYQRQLDDLVDAMNKSVLWWVGAAYNGTPPSMAMDASSASVLSSVIKKLARRWIRQFDEAAVKIADSFATDTREIADGKMRRALRDAGFTVKFQQSSDMKDAFDSVVGENVGLIRSIPSEQFTKIEGAVMRSVQAGRNLKQLQDELMTLGAKSKKRAAFIARDQNNKATAAMSKARRLSLGITSAKWKHSGGGTHPRPSHVEADGTVYDIAQGCLIDGEYIMPGELPNCGCTSAAVIPGFED